MQEHNLNREGPGNAEALTPAERELERALGALSPARPALNRERVLFEAGRAVGDAAGRRRLFAWRTAAAVLLVGLGLALAMEAEPRVIESDRIVYLPSPEVPEAPAPSVAQETDDGQAEEWAAREEHLLTSHRRPLVPASDADYLAIRDAVLRWGVRGMPSPPAGAGASPAAEPTVDHLLGIPPRKPSPRRIDLKGLLFGDRL
jgi:hypothetical protein